MPELNFDKVLASLKLRLDEVLDESEFDEILKEYVGKESLLSAERKNLSNNGYLGITILVNTSGNIHNKPIINFKGLPISNKDDFKYLLQEEIEKLIRTFSLNNKKQQENLIETLKINCRKIEKEKTGKKPITNINLVRV